MKTHTLPNDNQKKPNNAVLFAASLYAATLVTTGALEQVSALTIYSSMIISLLIVKPHLLMRFAGLRRNER